MLRWVLLLALLMPSGLVAQPIDRRALVSRHAPVLTAIDRHSPLMVGNGEIAFTADITGLQTFPEAYAETAPLLTMAQWAWHSFPNPRGFTEADGLVPVPVPGRGEQPYAWMRDWAELETRPALNWLRENPHRFSLGRVGLALKGRDGRAATAAMLSDLHQRLDLWTGTLHSRFRFDGEAVEVETRMHPTRDMLLVVIRSRLVADGRLAVDIAYPGVAAKLNPDPSDWTNPGLHRTTVLDRGAGHVLLHRRIDATELWSAITAPGAKVVETGPHRFRVSGSGDRIVLAVTFDRTRAAVPSVPADGFAAAVAAHWSRYWSEGGMVDFSGSSDPRAAELERRVVLSQYLMAVNAAGSLPPQEEGLFSNSWNGKFHLEMHPMHAAHFAQWSRPALLERSLGWYLDRLSVAQAEARRHGLEGAWWPKMVGPEGRNSPSTINPFIMWQQPHPIFMAELVRRAKPGAATLERYAALVEETARLLARWPREEGGRLVLGPPVIPVQENHYPLTTINPAFELEYFRWGLAVAQQWRERRGVARDPAWDRTIAALPPIPSSDGLYLPVESAPDFWRDAATAKCRRNAVDHTCLNRDHPSFVMAYGFIPGPRVDPATMRRTFAAAEDVWDFRQTWGWDAPMMAMAAARLGDRDKAVEWLLRDLPNNRFGAAGMVPRLHLEAHAAELFAKAPGSGTDDAGYRRAADTYFPANGSLLLAVGMMAAGWDGSESAAPGFPAGWKVRVEGITPLP